MPQSSVASALESQLQEVSSSLGHRPYLHHQAGPMQNCAASIVKSHHLELSQVKIVGQAVCEDAVRKRCRDRPSLRGREVNAEPGNDSIGLKSISSNYTVSCTLRAEGAKGERHESLVSKLRRV